MVTGEVVTMQEVRANAVIAVKEVLAIPALSMGLANVPPYAALCQRSLLGRYLGSPFHLELCSENVTSTPQPRFNPHLSDSHHH